MVVLNLMNISNKNFNSTDFHIPKKKKTTIPSFGSKIGETPLTFIYALDNEGSV
jgi:hypothetical protein